MRINNIVVRWVGQRNGANYAPAYPGEHVHEYLTMNGAKEELLDDPFGCDGDTILLWRCDSNDSQAEAHSRTCSDAAEADALLTLHLTARRSYVTTERLNLAAPTPAPRVGQQQRGQVR